MGWGLRGLALLSVCSSGFAATAGRVFSYRDIEYERVNGEPLKLDAAVPRGAGPFPAVIIVHGGAWVGGDRRVDVQPLFEPLSDAGFAWFSITYRLMTEVTQFGDAIEDVDAAVRYVKTHAEEYRVDPKRVALLGESAGGQLAAMAALSSDPLLRVRAVVALYAPTDLLALARDSKFAPRWVHDHLGDGDFAWLVSGRLKQLSPVDHVRRDMPPFLLIHGTADPLVPFEQSREMCARMKSVGAQCELYPVEGAGHGVRWWESSPAISEAYKVELVRWLRQHLES